MLCLVLGFSVFVLVGIWGMRQSWACLGGITLVSNVTVGASAVFAAAAALLAVRLPRPTGTLELPEGADRGGD